MNRAANDVVDASVAGTSTLVEPVGGQAVLVRAPSVCYTEVGGASVIVHGRDRLVYQLTPDVLGLWAGLDGRTVAALLADVAIEPHDDHWYLIIDALRRMKANGLIQDQDPATAAPSGDDGGVAVAPVPSGAGPVAHFSVTGQVVPVGVGASAATEPVDVVLAPRGAPGDLAGSAEAMASTDATQPNGVVTVDVTILNGVATVSVTGREIRAVSFAADAFDVDLAGCDPATDPVIALSCWVKAIASTADLENPDVIDTLAAVAEIQGLMSSSAVTHG